MSMFKTRNKKIYAGDSRVTLDAKHQDILSQYATDDEKLKAKKKEIHDIQKKIKQLKARIQENQGIPLIQEHHTLYQYEGELEQKQSEYERLQHNKGAQEYFLKTGDLLCQYYQHLEEVADHSGTSPPDSEKKSKSRGRPALSQRRGVKAKGKRNFSWMENTSTRGTNILSFFQQQGSTEDTEDTENSTEHTMDEDGEEHIQTPSSSSSPSISKENSLPNDGEEEEAYPTPNIVPDADFDRATALQHYLQEIDPNYKPPKSHTWMVDFCPVCLDKENQRRELLLQPSDGVLTCQVCGHMEQVVIDSEKPSYKDPPPEATYFAYKRINHYNEWLNQIQAKESTEIPPEVYQYILEEIRKERITDLGVLTNEKVRSILKKLRLNKYYEHIPHIINKLNGLPPPILTREVEEKLRVMFREIQGPFLEVCPKDRKNFLSYSYTLHKCVELLGLDEYKSLFPLLKSREKLHKTDLLWEKICAKLGWTFHKSI